LLELAASWQRVPLEILARAPARVGFSTHLANPFQHPIEVDLTAAISRHSASAALRLAPGASRSIPLVLAIDPGDDGTDLIVRLHVVGMGTLSQRSNVVIETARGSSR
jgi:hypothetical protein